MKYRILFDYHCEGLSFHDDDNRKVIEYDTVKDAVSEAMALGYTAGFLIVSVHEWEAVERIQEPCVICLNYMCTCHR